MNCRYSFFANISKMHLKMCARWGDCTASREADPLLFPEWYYLYPGNASSPLHCWDEENTDPYGSMWCMICSIVLVKRSSSLPSFDERIIRTTDLDVEWLMELRYAGFDFSVLSHGWFIDVKDYKFILSFEVKE